MSFLFLGLLVLVVVVGLVIAGIAMLVTKGFRLGHATLNCPQCGNETPANRGACQHCGQKFG